MKYHYVYIAGPYSKGVVNHNVRDAIITAKHLVRHGFEPYIPHLSHLWDIVDPHPWEYWLQRDIKWLYKCDCVLRLPGESSGADYEVLTAKAHGLPIFNSIYELLEACDKKWVSEEE